MDLDRYKGEMVRLQEQRQDLEEIAQELEGRSRQEQADRKALEALHAFCDRVGQGLESMNFEERQRPLRLVVEGITVERGRVKVQTVIPLGQQGKLRVALGSLSNHEAPVRPVLRQAQSLS